MKTSSNILAEIKLAYRKHQISELELEIKVIEYAEMHRKEQLLIHSVVDSSNKGIEEIHKLIVKYSEAEKDIIKRREAVTDVWEITVVDLQLKTNKQFVNDLMLAAGALL